MKDINKQMSRSIKVLIVDDSVSSRTILAFYFTRMGCRVTLAENGEASVLLLMRDYFDLIVLDWNMPKLNGLETLLIGDRIVSHKSFSTKYETKKMLSIGEVKIPVIIYSESDFCQIDFPMVDCLVIRSLVSKSLTPLEQELRFKQAIDSLHRWKLA